jgi:hypothetical protein
MFASLMKRYNCLIYGFTGLLRLFDLRICGIASDCGALWQELLRLFDLRICGIASDCGAL